MNLDGLVLAIKKRRFPETSILCKGHKVISDHVNSCRRAYLNGNSNSQELFEELKAKAANLPTGHLWWRPEKHIEEDPTHFHIQTQVFEGYAGFRDVDIQLTKSNGRVRIRQC